MATIPLFSILASIGDPDGTRTITSIIVLLVAIGLALILLAVWIFRATRPDPDLLAPLEVMGERSWRRKDPVWQRRRLDELRPPGAKPLVPSAAPPELDESFEAGPTATGFDDLQVAEPLRVAEPSDAQPDITVAEAGRPVDEPVADHDTADDGTAEDGTAEGPTGDGPTDDESPEVPRTPDPAADRTPPGLIGPALDDLPDDDFDPEALAAARAELERELADATQRAEQLGLFEHDDRS